MFFTKEALLAANSRYAPHWASLWTQRNLFNHGQEQLVRSLGPMIANDPEMLAANCLQGRNPEAVLANNALAGLPGSFWQQVDAQIVQMRDQEVGMEIVADLLTLQTVLPIGKTAKLYNIAGDIASDVSVSLDGQAPYSFDHTDYTNDGDPVPIFTAGYGVNWRMAAGLSTVGIDLVLDSQAAKMRKYNEQLVDYVLNGAASIQVAGYPAQGIKNHRNTAKLNLGSTGGGANIDLTTATAEQLIAFFSSGAFAQILETNKIKRLGKLWFSMQIMRRLGQPYLITLGTNGGTVAGTVLDAIRAYIPADSIEGTYALTGNEFLGYEKRQDVITPLVGMPTGVVPLPRPMPQTNYNFQIMGAMGLQIKRDGEGLSGVIYAADLD